MNDEDDDAAVTRRLESAADDPTVAIPPVAPQGHRLPQRGSSATPRRRWPLVALFAVLVIAAGLAGAAISQTFWGPGEQISTQGLTDAPQVESAEELPREDGFGGPRDYGQPYSGPGPDGSSESGSGAADSLSDADVSSIAAAVSPGLVDINVTLAYGGGGGAGTGIVLTSSGQVLTSNHVIQGASEINVTSVGSGETYSATVLGYDRSHDVALLQLSGASGLQTLPIGDSSTVSVGDAVVAIGNAGGDGGDPTAVGGSVSALDQQIVAAGPGGAERLTGLIEISANVQSGQSGGPTVNTAGEVIGITTAASVSYSFDQAGNAGYAVPVEQAVAIARQIEQGSSSASVHVGPTAFLGVQVASSSGPRGYGAYAGATVTGVLPDTPAEAAGMQSGDEITSVGGSGVDSASALTSLVGSYSPGDRVEVVWIDRSGEEHAATVELTQGPPG